MEGQYIGGTVHWRDNNEYIDQSVPAEHSARPPRVGRQVGNSIPCVKMYSSRRKRCRRERGAKRRFGRNHVAAGSASLPASSNPHVWASAAAASEEEERCQRTSCCCWWWVGPSLQRTLASARLTAATVGTSSPLGFILPHPTLHNTPLSQTACSW